MLQNSTESWISTLSHSPLGWEFTEKSLKGMDHYKFEEMDQFYWMRLMESNTNVVIYTSILYIVTIFGLQRWMRDRPAYDLKTPLILWNAGIGLFSLIGFIRTAPGFIAVLSQPGGLYQSICEKKGADAQFPAWAILFVLSKFVELGDTVLIVLRKRPLIFLQWWHHMVTMMVGWTIAPYAEPVTRYMLVLNLGVHSVMYPYFSLRAMGKKLPVFVPNFITTIQFAQIVTCAVANFISSYLYLAGKECYRNPFSVKASGFVGITFLFLFGKLFVDSVVKKGRAKREHKTKKVE